MPDRHHGFGTWAKAPRRGAACCASPRRACDYWIFQLCNLWQENFDNYEDGQGHVTKYRCTLEPDGSVWVVIADRRSRASVATGSIRAATSTAA